MGGRGTPKSHECTFQPLITGFKACYAAFLGFKLARSFIQTSSCFQTAFYSCAVVVETSHSAETFVFIWTCVMLGLQTCNSYREHEPVGCVLNEFSGSSASQEWLKGQLFSWWCVCDFVLMVYRKTSACFSFLLKLSCCGSAFCECLFWSVWSAWTHSWTCAVCWWWTCRIHGRELNWASVVLTTDGC